MKANERDCQSLMQSDNLPRMAKAYLFVGSVNLAKTGKKARQVGQFHLARPILEVTQRLMKANERDSQSLILSDN